MRLTIPPPTVKTREYFVFFHCIYFALARKIFDMKGENYE